MMLVGSVSETSGADEGDGLIACLLACGIWKRELKHGVGFSRGPGVELPYPVYPSFYQVWQVLAIHKSNTSWYCSSMLRSQISMYTYPNRRDQLLRLEFM